MPTSGFICTQKLKITDMQVLRTTDIEVDKGYLHIGLVSSVCICRQYRTLASISCANWTLPIAYLL